MARISSAVLTHTKGVAPAFQLAMKVAMAPRRSLTLRKLPRRMAWRLRTLNHVST